MTDDRINKKGKRVAFLGKREKFKMKLWGERTGGMNLENDNITAASNKAEVYLLSTVLVEIITLLNAVRLQL